MFFTLSRNSLSLLPLGAYPSQNNFIDFRLLFSMLVQMLHTNTSLVIIHPVKEKILFSYVTYYYLSSTLFFLLTYVLALSIHVTLF